MIAPTSDAAASRSLARLRPALADEARRVLGRGEAVAFLARLDLWFADIHGPISALYGEQCDGLIDELVRHALAAADRRPPDLRDVDRRREIDPRWYQHQRMVGYVAYTDRFAGTLEKLSGRLDHLAELGVTYLHLMPLLKPREGANDGGYAVADYRAVDPRLGTMDDLENLATELRARDMSLCVDLVLNHTAREHPWARGWLAGEPDYADFYYAFPDRTMPDAYEATIVDVFPDQAPGSFTWVEEAAGGAGAWVWTTFFTYQWDLNWGSPRVFAAVLDTILWLANRGVEIFRMDAVPFMGKRLGTSCMNQPEVHDIVQALHALTKLAAPAVVFKAEAIVAPDDLVAYLGGHHRYRPECELAYHNQLMVMLWSSLATKDARLAVQSLQRLRPIPTETSWATYVRCHDDIGWAVGDVDARAVGFAPHAHRDFLNAFFSGPLPALLRPRRAVRGEPGERRRADLRLRRGAVRDQRGARAGRPRRAGAGDPAARAAARGDPGLGRCAAAVHGRRARAGQRHAPTSTTRRSRPTTAGCTGRTSTTPPRPAATTPRRSRAGCSGGSARSSAPGRGCPSLHAAGESAVLTPDSPHVLAWRRRHPRSGNFVGLVNFAEEAVTVDPRLFDGLGELATVLSSDGPPLVQDGRLQLPALSFVWLAEE